MSAMFRDKAGGSAGKARRTRSFSLSDGSSVGSSDSEEAGARLSPATMNNSPPRVRFAPVIQEFSRMSVTSSDGSAGSDRDAISSPFQLGEKPSGDVFTSSPEKTTPKLGQDLTSPTRAAFAENKMAKTPITAAEGRRITRSATTGSALVLATPGDRAGRAHSSRHEIGGIDAQGIYPPSACVFVANLAESKEDRALEAAVTREFSRFGTVFVKIRREVKHTGTGMPYAFAQFTNDEDAKNAFENGKGIIIFGRPCRTEMVKANRTFVIYGRRGAEVTTDVAKEILEPYGQISKCEPLGAQMQAAMNLPPAVLVEFAKFDPKRDLNSAVRQYDGYHIDAFDVKKKVSRADADEEYLRQYDVDRRTIWVGNLTLGAEKEDLINLFSAAGEVMDASVVQRTNYQGTMTRAFGFVEFSRADTPDVAIKNFDGTSFRGNVLKVERRSFKHVATPRRVKSQAFSTKSSTTPKTPRAGSLAKSPAAPGGSQPSGKEETPAPAAEQGYLYPGVAQPFMPLGYPVPSPAAPNSGQPLVGASGLPVTPTTPFAPNPFTYTGGYWPGMSIAQDPITGHTFWTYTPPVPPTNAPTETPTRGRGREHQYFHGA